MRKLIILLSAFIAVIALGIPAASAAPRISPQTTTCYLGADTGQQPITQSDGSAAFFDPDEYGSTAKLKICTPAGGSGYNIRVSDISVCGDGCGQPGAYVDDAVGCIGYGLPCSTGWTDLTASQFRNGSPIQLTFSAIAAGNPDTTADLAFDSFWLPQGTQRCATCDQDELMIQYDMQGPVVPAMTEVETGITIGGVTYNVWWGGNPSNGVGLISFQLASGNGSPDYTTSESGFDTSPVVRWALNHDDPDGYPYITAGYVNEFDAIGNELWTDGAGWHMTSDLISYPASAGDRPQLRITGHVS